jgi:hypothetical protein
VWQIVLLLDIHGVLILTGFSHHQLGFIIAELDAYRPAMSHTADCKKK